MNYNTLNISINYILFRLNFVFFNYSIPTYLCIVNKNEHIVIEFTPVKESGPNVGNR